VRKGGDMSEITFPYYEDDGLVTPLVRKWVEEKYRLVYLYDRLFSTGMKRVWDCRTYIDLYAGAGRSRIEGTNHILPGSPFLALSGPDKFDKYIFCEKDGALLQALQQRVEREHPGIDVTYIEGDCNSTRNEIIKAIPAHSMGKKVLSFCFIDPFNISIRFETIQALSQKFMDFLIVLAVGMDATRNEQTYARAEDKHVENFLGVSNWRVRWQQALKQGMTFRHFLTQEYASQMEALGYKKVPLSKMKEVQSDERNLPLYHMAFFSKHDRGYNFWDEVLKYSTPQQKLPGIE
jgi:three-Cys-motif partner protein